MKQSSKRIFSMVAALAFVVIALVMFFDLIEPEYQNILALKGTLLGEENFLTSETGAVSKAEKIINTYQNQGQEEQNLALAMPTGEDLAGAITQIYGVAESSGIGITNVTISAPVIQAQSAGSTGAQAGSGGAGGTLIKPMGSISFQLQGSGSYENLKTFLSQIATNIRIFDVKAISLHPAPAIVLAGKNAPPPNPDFFDYNITLAAYYELP